MGLHCGAVLDVVSLPQALPTILLARLFPRLDAIIEAVTDTEAMVIPKRKVAVRTDPVLLV